MRCKNPKPRHNLLGRRFGRLEVIDGPIPRSGRKIWTCKCDCGALKKVTTSGLLNGKVKSCGCLEQEKRSKGNHVTHGLTRRGPNSVRNSMFLRARARSISNGVPFSIVVDDIEIPERCPIFGILLVYEPGGVTDNTPSLDRIIPALGYIKGNVKVISQRANRLKSNATVEELEAIIEYIKRFRGERPSEKLSEDFVLNEAMAHAPGKMNLDL